jgi:anti-anti-sigma factor
MARTGSSSPSRDDPLGAFVVSDGGAVTVELRGDYDLSTVPTLVDALVSAIVAGDADLIVDVSEVRFMDSASVHVFEHAADFLANRSRQLVLRSPSPFLRRLLALCEANSLVRDAPYDLPESIPAAVPIDPIGPSVPLPLTA